MRERAIAGAIRKAVVEVELHGGVRIGQAYGGRGPRTRQPRVSRMAMHPSFVDMAPPEWIEQLEHHRWMEHGGVLRARCGQRGILQTALKGGAAHLLLLTGGAHPIVMVVA